MAPQAPSAKGVGGERHVGRCWDEGKRSSKTLCSLWDGRKETKNPHPPSSTTWHNPKHCLFTGVRFESYIIAFVGSLSCCYELLHQELFDLHDALNAHVVTSCHEFITSQHVFLLASHWLPFKSCESGCCSC